jgi:hypothetical protein
MRGLEIQLRTRSRILNTNDGQALSFGFSLGPIQLFIIANMPESPGSPEGPLVYVKMNLETTSNWHLFREHNSTESDKR